MDNDIYSNCKDFYRQLYIDNKVKAFEIKILTYIDIYNIKYIKINEDSDARDSVASDSSVARADSDDSKPIIKYSTIKLERIGNVEILYNNFNNKNKIIAKQLSYSIHKINMLVILDTLHYIMNTKERDFDFNIYNYELYNVIGIDNIYVIQQKNKNLNYNFTGSCIMLIFIRDKMFIHYY